MKEISAIVEGGKATAGPPLGPALGPLGVNAANVVAEINKLTKDYSGMKVPVTVKVDPKSKQFTIDIGSPPVGEMIKNAAGVPKGAGTKDAPAGNLSIEAAAKIAKSNRKSLGADARAKLKEVVSTCRSMGITIDGKKPAEIVKEIDEGKHDSLLKG